MLTTIETTQTSIFSGFVNQEIIANVTLLSCPSYCTRHYFGLYYTALLLCSEPGDTPCGRCSHCLSLKKNTHVDFIHIKDTDRIKIDRIREIQDLCKFGPTIAKRQIVLIEHAELLTEQAANACLKTFESPPENVHFILLAPHRASLLPTIVSRSQEVALTPFNAPDLSKYLSHFHEQAIDIFSKFTKLPEGLKSQLGDLLLSHQEIRPLSFTKFMKQNPIEDFELAEEWSKEPDICRFYLLYWMEELWFFKGKMPQAIQAEELIIEIISNMKYTINLKLHLEALFLSIRSLWGQ